MVRVLLKRKWADAWSPAPLLRPLQATIAAAPLKSVASFEWLIGRVKWAYSNSFAYSRYTDLRDNWVKVERLADNGAAPSNSPGNTGSTLWVGRISEGDVDFQGVSDDGNGAVPRGRNVLTAYGLEHELDRSPIRDSLVTNNTNIGPGGITDGIYVDAPLVFNEQFDGPSGLNKVGNRSLHFVTHPAHDGRAYYAFAGDKGQTQPWTVADIVRYLLEFYSPEDVRFTLAGNVSALEQLVLPRVDLSGRTVFQSLNHLIDRRRGLGWCLRHGRRSDGTDAVAVHVYSVLDEAVKFDDATIDANAEQVRLDLDGLGLQVDDQNLQVDTLGRFGKIVVAGKRILSCFSLNMATDETLENGWTPAEETTYRHASNSDDDAANRKARAVDSLAHVYRHFHIPKSFDWKTSNGTPGKVNANPFVDFDGRISVTDSKQSPIRNWGHRLERHLPFVKTQAKADSEPEYLEPFALVYDDSGRAVYAHSADHSKGHSATIRMLDTTFGLEVRFNPNHLLAKGVFDADATEAGVTGIKAKKDKVSPAYDFRSMIVTVAARLDARLRVIVDVDPQGPIKDRVLFIEVPDAELHYVVPGTVKGVDPAGAVQYSTAAEAVLRDDGDRLRRIAAMAKAWYAKERAAISLTVKDLWQQYPVGSLVLSVSDKLNSRTVNTPVSQITYDLVNMKTTLRTNWAELDVTIGRSPRRRS